jgi:hypothetical protein
MISIYFYDRDQSGIADIDVEMLRRRWDSERRRNTDAQIDDRRTASVDRSENVDESTTGSASDWSTDKLNSVTDW